MEIVSQSEIHKQICKLRGKFGLYMSICNDDDTTEDEMNEWFNATVGDDGPTPTNSYNGETRIYAHTIHKDGYILNENT